MTVGNVIACSCSSYAKFSGQCREGDQGGCERKRDFRDTKIAGSYYRALHACSHRHMRGQIRPVQCHTEALLCSRSLAKATNLNGMKLGTFFWEHKANGVSVKFYRMCHVNIFNAAMGSRYAGDHCSLMLKCFLSEAAGGNPGNSLKGDMLNISCIGQGSSSDIAQVDSLEYESDAELASTETLLNQMQPAVLNDTFCDSTNGVPYETRFMTKVDAGEVLSFWQTFPKRWIIVLLCFFAFLLCNMDRVNMSIAILPMSAEFHWNSTTVGLVQSSFFWGYLLTQIAGGIWADSIGGKQVLGFGVIWWSLATVLTPFAAKAGLPILLFVRACMGIGEGVAMPAMNNLLSKWVPVKERSRSLALVYSGMHLGSVTGLAFSPTFIHKFNWPSVFISFGSLGILWFAAWQYLAYSSPFEDPTMSSEERYLLVGNNQTKEPIAQIPWRLLLSKSPVWALIVCHFCHNWGTFILLTWMPTYYCQVLKFNLMESGMFSVLPWLTMALSANLGGWIADALVSKGVSITIVRKVMQTIGFLGPALSLTLLSHAKSPALAVCCMMCSQGCDAFSQSGLYSNHQDIGPRYAGVLLGLSNTAGVLAGVIGTAATGYILQHGTWNDVFKVAVGLYIFGTVFWNIFCTGEQIFD